MMPPEPPPSFGHDGRAASHAPYREPAREPSNPQFAARPLRAEPTAVLAMVLGLGSVICFGFITGIPAVVIGGSARRRILVSHGLLGGEALALAGVVLGAVGTILSLTTMAIVGSALVVGFHLPATVPPKVAEAPAFTVPTNPRALHGFPAGPPLAVVDISPSRTPLRDQLREEAAAAEANHQTLVVQTTADGCGACSEIARAMEEESFGDAMVGIRIARVDVTAFRHELAPLRLNENGLPWFFILDAKQTARDAISADEWDENVPENIAPVLVDFAHGSLIHRRDPQGTEL